MKHTIFLLLAGGLGWPAALHAHDGAEPRIAVLTQRLAADSGNAALYFERGEAHCAVGHWELALADYQTAARLVPGERIVDLARGRALMGAGRLEEVRELMDALLAMEPGWAEALALQARAQEAPAFFK